MIIEILNEIFNKVLKELNIDSCANIIKSNRPELCDYQYDGVFKLASILHENPIQIGEKIVNKVNELEDFNHYFKSVEFVKPGFINIIVSDELINELLLNISTKEHLGIKEPENKETFFLDYGGYNIAKPLHIGHLRPTIIGESIKRIIKYMGHNVIADVHLGDIGLQMGQVIYGIKRDNLKAEDITIDYLNKIYPEISGLCKENEEVKQECALITKELQENNLEYKEYWNKIVEVSIEDAKKICDYLGVSFDLWQGESHAFKYLNDVEQILDEKQLLELSEGALVVNVKKEEDNKPMPPMMFKKSNGAYVYDSTDLATIYERKQKYNPDHIIYITDFRQNLHFEQVFRASDLADIMPYNSLEHAYNGTINGTDGKPFKTREGNAPKLGELFDLVKDTFVSLKDTNKDMSKEDLDIIVNAIIKYADLQNNREKDYIFDIAKFSNVVGKTGPYVLYTYVRINKILKEYDNINLNSVIYNESDRNLRKKIVEFDLDLQKAFKDRMPSSVAEYIYDLCVNMNTFYQNNHINGLEDESQKSCWLYVLKTANQVLKELLYLLMIDIPTIM